MENRKKKIIIISSVIAVIFVSALAILIFNNIKKERELQEAIKLEQELEEKALKEQQEQEEKERQERVVKLEEGWNALGENQEYLALGSDHLKRTINSDETSDFTWSVEFIGALYMINDGVFNGIKKHDLNTFLDIALQDLPDNATGKEVYDAILKATELINVEELKNNIGEDPLAGLIQTDPEPTQSQQQTNQSSSNKNNNSSSSNKNNSSNNNQSSTPPADNSNESSGDGSSFASQFGGSQVEGNPEDNQGEEIPGFEIHN